MSTTFSLPGFGNNSNFSLGDAVSGATNIGSALYGLGVIGGNGVATDRGAQLGARGGLWNVFNYGFPQGQNQQATGQQTMQTALSTLQQPQSYWQRLLSGGRTDYAQLSAPAVSAVQNGADAVNRQQGTFGTARTGGATALNAERASNTQSQIDQIINQNLMQGKAAGAEGLQQVSSQQAQIGSVQLQNSLQLLGLSTEAVNAIMGDARLSQMFQNILHRQNTDAIKKLGQQIANAIGSGNNNYGVPTKPFTNPPGPTPPQPVYPWDPNGAGMPPNIPGSTPPSIPGFGSGGAGSPGGGYNSTDLQNLQGLSGGGVTQPGDVNPSNGFIWADPGGSGNYGWYPPSIVPPSQGGSSPFGGSDGSNQTAFGGGDSGGGGDPSGFNADAVFPGSTFYDSMDQSLYYGGDPGAAVGFG